MKIPPDFTCRRLAPEAEKSIAGTPGRRKSSSALGLSPEKTLPAEKRTAFPYSFLHQGPLPRRCIGSAGSGPPPAARWWPPWCGLFCPAGWDGERSLWACDVQSRPVGGRVCPERKIYIDPQGMCIMAGIGVENGRVGERGAGGAYGNQRQAGLRSQRTQIRRELQPWAAEVRRSSMPFRLKKRPRAWKSMPADNLL